MPKFSVVISVYNKEKYISKTLQSVLDQTFQDFKIVILNDGSTDSSEEEILKFTDKRIRYFSEKNQGAAAGRNYVIKKAKGEYLAFLDADDYWHPNHLQEFDKSISKFPKESVFANALEICEKNTISIAPYNFIYQGDSIKTVNYFESSMMSSILHSSNFAVKSGVINEIGFYNKKYKTGEDTDLYVRLGLKSQVVFNPVVTARFYRKEDGLDFTNRTLKDKATFDEYDALEHDNLSLKRFLDINRYSLCIIAKLEGNTRAYGRLRAKIDSSSLNKKQLFLLNQSKTSLAVLLKSKEWLEKAGIKLSAFK